MTTPTNASYSGGTWVKAYEIVSQDLPRSLAIISSTASAAAAEVLIPQVYGLGTGPAGWTPDEAVKGEILDPGRSIARSPNLGASIVQVYIRSAGATVSVGVAGGR